MKRILVFVIPALFVLSACSSPRREGMSILEKVRRTHIINAAVVIDPPMVIKDPVSGKYSGHLVEAMGIIAERMNAEIQWTETTYGNAAGTLQSGRTDVVVAPLFANIERAQAVAFIQPPLFYMGLSALVKKGSRFENVTDVYQFDKLGIKVALATGEAGDLFATADFQKATLSRTNVEAAEISRFMLDVLTGNADVAIADSNQIAKFAKAHPGTIDLFAKKQFALNPACFAVRYGDPDWKAFLETSLHFLRTRGVLKQLELKYGANWQHDLK